MNEEQALLVDLQAFANSIVAKMDSNREKERTIYKRTSNWASDLFHPCIRYHYYQRLHGDEKRLVDTNLLYRFEEGKTQEKVVKRMFEDIGVDVELTQQYFTWDKYEISGRIDGMIQIERKKYPIEIKSITPYFWDSTKSIKEMKEHPSIWVRKIIVQLNIYLFMSGSETGFLVLKTFGKRPRILPMLIDYDLGEECILRACKINSSVKKKIIPDQIHYSSILCDGCDFEHLCQPVTTSTIQTDIDSDTKKLLFRYGELDRYAKEFKEFKKIDKILKETFRGVEAIVEGFEIFSKEYFRTNYNIPKDIKEPYAEKVKAHRTTIRKIA